MNEIGVKAEHNYSIHLDANFTNAISEISTKYNKVLVLVPEDLKIKKLKGFKYPKNFTLFTLPGAEKQKDLQVLSKIWKASGDINLGRKDAMVAIGGGATTDVTGFAAASWLRGIDWYAIPTSLAGMVDAAIGGKTGINTSHGKNLVGAFHSPRAVYVDYSFLESLPARDLSAGMSEVIKSGFIADTKILRLSESYKSNLPELVTRSIAVKAKVVSKDLREGKLREILNYGHTLAHAIEKMEKYSVRHGEAVAIGLVFSAELSHLEAGLSQENVKLHRDLLGIAGLEITYPLKSFEKLLALMGNDKKSRDNQIRFIGLAKPGRPVWLESVNVDQLKLAYERIAK